MGVHNPHPTTRYSRRVLAHGQGHREKPNHVLEQETKNLQTNRYHNPKRMCQSQRLINSNPEKAETSHAHEDSTVHQGAHASQASMQQTQPADTVSEEVIYPHHELLQTHPVAALRAQARDSGHWSARYIPPFPPDDVEANELARSHYIKNYHNAREEYYHPAAVKAKAVIRKWSYDSGAFKMIKFSLPVSMIFLS